jgi:hypothetical protein
MQSIAIRRSWTILLITLMSGCSAAEDQSKGKPGAKDTDQVLQQFVALQAAIKDKNGDQLWELLDSDSRADAERAAKAVQTAYEKASPQEKEKRREELGLSDRELIELTGPVFLKSKRFHGKYHEIPGSKVNDVKVQAEEATVSYTEADGDPEKLTFNRQDRKWKVSLRMP